MTQRVTATQFMQVLTSGRTSPILCGCTDPNGFPAGEFVVKLLGQPPTGNCGALFELIASLLAAHFGILVPQAAVVEINPVFGELLSSTLPDLAPAIKSSIGLNFGTRVMHPMNIWFVGRTIPEAMFSSACSIFAFDALIQNPDRRVEKPNLFTQGDDLYIFDHESAFSFLLLIGPSQKPWQVEADAYLERHALYSRLKGKDLDLAEFEKKLKALTDTELQRMWQKVPTPWRHAHLAKIESHLIEVREHSEEFVEQIRRRLV